jgi:hypothetical protein
MWTGARWKRMHKTRFKVMANAQRVADQFQKTYRHEIIRLQQHPPAVVANNQHVLKGSETPAPIYGAMRSVAKSSGKCTAFVSDLLPGDLYAFNGDEFEVYRETAQWHMGEWLISWDADGTGWSTHREDQHGRKVSRDVMFRVSSQKHEQF